MPLPGRSSGYKRVTSPQRSQPGAKASTRSRGSSSPRIRTKAQKGSVLVIEDDSQVRDFIRISLQAAGFQVTDADNGAEGIGLYRQAPQDLVITDMLLPVTSGLRVIQELTAEFPGVKVIAITGESVGPDYLSLANQYGATRTLKKPFGPRELVRLVENALNSSARHG